MGVVGQTIEYVYDRPSETNPVCAINAGFENDFCNENDNDDDAERFELKKNYEKL